MSNLIIKKPLVRSFSLDFLEITWEIESSTLDPHDFYTYIYRSESPMGPWDLIAGPFEDKYRFIDNRVNLQHRWRVLYYKIRNIQKSDLTNIIDSESFSMDAEPDLMASEIIRLERLVWEEYSGRRCFIFPVRTFGQYCPSCMDGPDKGKGFTMQKRRSMCLTCIDTGYVRGYFDPIEIFIQIDPSSQSIQTLPIAERQQNDTTGRMPNFPLLKPRDIIVEAENKRWRVVKVSQTERLRHVVHQELQLHEIVKGDIEFQLPIQLDNLRNFEPSPGRNFTNPQNLENFELESIKNFLGIYGYNNC